MALGDGPDLGLGEVAHGEDQIAQLVLSQGEEEVALILGRIRAAREPVHAVLLHDARVVPGGQLGAQGARALEQEAELHVPVAGHAGDGRLPLQVALHEGVHHPLAEEVLHVGHVERDVERLGHPPGVVDVVGAAAAAALGLRFVGPHPQGDPDDLVPLLLEERGGCRGIHSTTHGDDDAHAALLIRSRPRPHPRLRGPGSARPPCCARGTPGPRPSGGAWPPPPAPREESPGSA